MIGDSAALVETLFETIPVALALLDRDLRLTRVNASFAALCDREVAALTGQPFAGAAPGLAVLLLPALRRTAASGQTGDDVEVLGAVAAIEPADGVWAATIYPLTRDDAVAGLALILLDVSEQRWAEQQLRRSEARFRSLVQNATDIVVVLDATGRVQYVSPSVRRVLGYDPAEVTGVNVFSLIHPDDITALQAIFAGVVAREGPFKQIEFRVRHADGSWRDVETMATNALADPAVRGIVQNVRDVSERKRIEAERDEQLVAAEEARAAAEAANRAKDLFLSIVSHELRTPLTPILAYANLLRTRPLNEEQRSRALEQIERSARTQARLVEDILDIARISTGKLTLERLRLELGGVLAAALETVRPDAVAKGVTLSARFDAAAEEVIGDAERLQQVVWNLLSNAIKFTPAGGNVEVALSRDVDHAFITVQDTGAGISPDFLPFVFERFRQAESAYARQHRGLGLGLALVREIVALHGGSVAATSPGEGLGATFIVTLPLAGAPAEPLDTRQVGTARLAGVRALVVDDDEAAGALLRMVLEQEGARVEVVASAAAARAVFDRSPPDLLIGDLGLPGESGYTLLETLRARTVEQGGGVPALAVTAYVQEADIARARAAGYDRHLAKPVDPDALIAAIMTLLGLPAHHA
jgi:PAS domain S-box-containing protein